MAIHIRRREFIFTLGGAAVAWPLAARAQQPKVPTIGALVIGNISPEEFWREFRQGLRDLGYIEGQNIRFEFRSAEGQIDRLPELAAELVRLKVDVIVTWFTPTAVAAKQATREIPIVMAETGDPIGTGLVMSLPRPGGNVTGIASVTAELSGKCVQLIRDMLPSARRVTALANATDPFSKPFLEQIELGGEATGTAIQPIRRAGAATPRAGGFRAALVRRPRRADVVLRDICGPFSQGCRVRRQNPQRRPARRFAGRAANSFPTGHQYENRQGAWHYCATGAPHPRRRGDRIRKSAAMRMSPFGTTRTSRSLLPMSVHRGEAVMPTSRSK